MRRLLILEMRLFELLVLVVIVRESSAQNNGHVILEKMTWGEGYTECQARGQVLYNSLDLASVLTSGSGKHWIGAKVMISPWKWTEDSTAVFQYIGFRNTTSRNAPKLITENENEAVTCYVECKTKFIGLQGSKCYCLRGALDPPASGTEHEQDVCLGNSHELCGSQHGMSVYEAKLLQDKGSLVKWKFTEDAVCGYIHSKSGKLNMKTEKDCLKRKGFICSCSCTGAVTGGKRCRHDLCFEDHSNFDWFTANSNCSLLKPDAANIDWVFSGVNNGGQYWMGLKRYRYLGWANRADEISVYRNSSRGCISAQKLADGSVQFYVSPCDDDNNVICTTDTDQTTLQATSRGGSEDTTRVMSAHTLTTQKITTNQITTWPDTTSSNMTGNLYSRTSAGAVAGAVSAVVVGVILLSLCAAILWLRRTRRLCFKDLPAKLDRKKSVSNEVIIEPSTNHYDEPYYTEINGGYTPDDLPIYTYACAEYEFEKKQPEAPRPCNEYLELIPDPCETGADNPDNHRKVGQANAAETGNGQQFPEYSAVEPYEEIGSQSVKSDGSGTVNISKTPARLPKDLIERFEHKSKHLGFSKIKADTSCLRQTEKQPSHLKPKTRGRSDDHSKCSETKINSSLRPQARVQSEKPKYNHGVIYELAQDTSERKTGVSNSTRGNTKSAKQNNDVYELANECSASSRDKSDVSTSPHTKNQLFNRKHKLASKASACSNAKPDVSTSSQASTHSMDPQHNGDHVLEDECIHTTDDSADNSSPYVNSPIHHCDADGVYEVAVDPGLPVNHDDAAYNVLHAGNKQSSQSPSTNNTYTHIHGEDDDGALDADQYDKAGNHSNQNHSSDYNHLDMDVDTDGGNVDNVYTNTTFNPGRVYTTSE